MTAIARSGRQLEGSSAFQTWQGSCTYESVTAVTACTLVHV